MNPIIQLTVNFDGNVSVVAISRGSSSHWELKRSGTRPEIKINDRVSTEDVYADIYSCFDQM